MVFENFPERVNVELLLELADKDDVAGIFAEELAEAIAKNFDNIPENVMSELLLKFAEKDGAAKAIAHVVADKFEAIPENVRTELLFKLAENDSAAGGVAKAIAYNFDKLPENIRNLLFKLAENDSTASKVAHVVAHNKLNKIDEDVRNKLLLKLAEKDNVNWDIAYVVADKFNKLPENIRNELLLKTPNKDVVSLYVKWINELKYPNSTIFRNLSVALPELDRMCSLLDIGETIKEECAHLYREATDKGFVKGRSIESVIGAIIFYVTRNKGEPRTLEEIAEKSRRSKKEIGRSYKHVLNSMNLKPPKTNIEDYISFYAAKLGISNTAEEEAQKILNEAKKYGITAGRGPSGVAGAIISLACEQIREEFPKKELLDLVGITISTLHSRHDEIKSKIKEKAK
ncbi:MAG: hypothetical protein CVT88_03865 [Candidatus Altiarchaeales archaeon HGW-Altiarchaeales-1]|nr:MAG: hypothetical protein CVT88_03865 [Candidatus Altiarchaeales archaeon HGW-Altiarchaeales-1]